MNQIQRRKPNRNMPSAFNVTPQQAANNKQFNKDLRYVQGFRITVTGSSTTNYPIQLNAAGKFLLGIVLYPTVNTTDLNDTQVSFSSNNNNLLLSVGAQNLNPFWVQGMIYYPTPQELFSNDSLIMSFLKNDGTDRVAILNLYYVPIKA